VLLYPKQMGILAARAAGVTPLGVMASSANYRDLDGFRKAVANSRRFGVEGSACIHPDQVAILNEGFSPSAEEVAEAERVVETYRKAIEAGHGAVGLDGRMLDVPVVERSERVLEVAGRIAGRQARRSAA
jgi:citrate lyase subunit beta/citryl-CoA lyase